MVILLLFSNLNGNITGIPLKNIKERISRDITINASRSSNRLVNSPWPMFGHDLNHTGRSQYNTSKNNGQKKWEFATALSIHSSPAIGPDDTIYFGSSNHKLYALNPNGTVKWDYATGNFVDSSPAIGPDGTTYFGSSDDKLYALYPNGMKKWDFTTGGNITSSPAIGSDGTIYIDSENGKLYALFPNGTMKWDFTTGRIGFSSPAISSDGTIYVSSWDNGKLYALYPNGTKKWDISTPNMTYSYPAIGSDDIIYVGSFVSSYVGPADQFPDGIQYALYPNGTIKWDLAIKGGAYSSPAIGSDGTIYVGYGYDNTNSPVGKLYALNPNGTKKWAFDTGSYTGSSPSIGSDGTIYIGSGYPTESVYAISPNGTKKWNFATGGVVISSPAIGSDGTIYFGSEDGNLYALGTSNLSAPRNLQAIGGNAQVKLTWTAPSMGDVSTITNYTIYRGTISGSEIFLAKVGNVTTYRDIYVTNGQKYYYKVTATNTLGESPKSNEANATPATIPTAPLNLTAAPGNAQIVLSWKTSIDNGGFAVTNYKVYRNGTLLKVLGNVLNFTDSGLINGQTYLYNISAVNGIGEGPKSVGVQALPRTVPSAPQNLNVTLRSAQIFLTWLVPASNGGVSIKNYSIYRGTTSGSEILFIKGYTDGPSWVDANITMGAKYYYMVSAVNIVGEGPKSNEINITVGSSPGQPTRFTASEGNTQVLLKWSAPTSGGTPARYNIYRSDSQIGTYTLIGFSTTTQFRDKGLTNEHEYWYKINAQNPYGTSGNTTAVSATPYGTSIISSLLFILIIVIIVVIIIVETMRTSRKKKA